MDGSWVVREAGGEEGRRDQWREWRVKQSLGCVRNTNALSSLAHARLL